MEWVLIVYIYPEQNKFKSSSQDGVLITSIPGFSSHEDCILAGNAIVDLVEGTNKEVRYLPIGRKKI